MAAFKGKAVIQRTAIIDFEEGHLYHGREVRVRLNVPVEVGFTLNRKATSTDDAERAEALRLFAETLVLGWNLQEIPEDGPDDAEPVDIPFTPDAFCADMLFALEVMMAWMRVTQEVPRPLAPPSSDTPGSSPTPGLVLMEAS